MAAAALVAACDDEDTQQRANERFCDDTAELVASLRVIRDLDADTATIEEIEDARDRAQEAYDDLIESAADVVDVRLDELNEAYAELRQAVIAIDDDSTIPDALDDVDDELEAVALEASQVLNQVDCSDVGSESQSDE
jgi:hypothetical protein